MNLTPAKVMCLSVISAPSKWKKFMSSIVFPAFSAR